MKYGLVVETGTHEEIFHFGGVYKDIFDAMVRSLNIDKISRTLE